MTVLGPVAAQCLGPTLMHEHVMVDFIGAEEIRPGRYDPEVVFRIALPHLQRAKAAGCQTMVECTPAYIGRDAELLARLARTTRLNIITNTGLYGAAHDKYVPRFAYAESAEQLAARWVAEARRGIPPGGIRPGIIKIGVDAGPLSEIDAKLVAAAALTHRETGLCIASHTEDGAAAMAEIALLQKMNIELSAFIWVHAQLEADTKLHRQAAQQGAWVEFDGIAPDTIDQHVKLVLEMRRAGHLGRVLISQDAGWYHVEVRGGGEFRGYETLFTRFLPALRKAGLSESEIRTLTVRNPRNALLGEATG